MRDSWISRPWTRRQSLRAAAGAAAVLAGGAALAACAGGAGGTGSSTGGASTANPQAQAGVTKLLFQANVQGAVQWNKTTIGLYQSFVDDNFNALPQYKGLRATVDPQHWGNAQQQIAESIAGSGYDDVVMVCCNDVPTLINQNYLAPLTPLLRKDNISTNIWNQGHLAADSYAGTVYGMPAYDGTTVVFYRQDILDQLGLPYPDPTWDYQQAAQIWTSCAGTISGTSKHRYGVSLYWSGPNEQMNWWYRGWGTSPYSTDRTKATMYSPEGIACVTYAINMVQNKVATNRSDIPSLAAGDFAFEMGHSDHLIGAATQLGTQFKWDILPMPRWPAAKSTFNTIDMYGLNNASKNQESAWELLKWIQLGAAKGDGTYDYSWPKFQIQTNLITPSVLALWDYWEAKVKQVAPPLQNKAINWYADAAVNNYAYPGYYFQQAPVPAANLMNSWFNQIWNGQVSVPIGLQQMEEQINALEATAAQESSAAQQVTKLFPTKGASIAKVQPGL